jgi:RNA polymerase sigma-70 factor (ECF subfamily)
MTNLSRLRGRAMRLHSRSCLIGIVILFRGWDIVSSLVNENSFVAWLARISVRTCYDELRKQRRRSESSIGDLNEDESAYLNERLRDLSASGNVEGSAISRDLASKLLSRLKPEDRMVLTLLKLEELSVAEIAGLMGWTAAKVKMRSHRAQHGLRRLLRKFL